MGRPRQTHCKRGHEFTPENTYINSSDGRRRCLTCRGARYQPHPRSPKTHCKWGHPRTPDNVNRWHQCIPCLRAYTKTPEQRAYKHDYHRTPEYKMERRARWQRIKRIVIDGYGGKCVDCSCTDLAILDTDHVNGDGKADRQARREQGRVADNIHYLHSEHLRTGKWPDGIAVRCTPCHVQIERARRKNTPYPTRKAG